MSKTDSQKVCGAVYFGFEVVRCQLLAGHTGDHAVGKPGGLFTWTWIPDSYQAELHKAATLKEG